MTREQFTAQYEIYRRDRDCWVLVRTDRPALYTFEFRTRRDAKAALERLADQAFAPRPPYIPEPCPHDPHFGMTGD